MTTKTADRNFEAIRVEQAAFNSKLAGMMKDHAGQFVLFKAGHPVAFFPTYQDAYRAGLERFGVNEIFLVSEVKRSVPQTPSISFCSGAMSVPG